MENKITLEQLAVYLPYGLKRQIKGNFPIRENEDSFINDVRELSLLDKDLYIQLDKLVNWETSKPLLRPLSDYADINSSAMSELNCDLPRQIEIAEFANGLCGYWNVTYGTIGILAKAHIDIFNWIPQGLAVNLNTIER